MKNRNVIPLCMVSLLLFISCNREMSRFNQSKDGVVISLDSSITGGVKRLKINIISENTFQVLASATDSFSTRESLAVIDQIGDPIDFDVNQDGRSIIISTSKLMAKVNTEDGTIDFMDMNQNSLLKEKKRSFRLC